MNKLFLGVNIDHVATLRNMRGTMYPDPIQAAFIAEKAGADSITVHLREDRRHITERDINILRETLNTRMNIEIGNTDEMLDIVCKVRPSSCCLVPEKRQELTTEGGLNVIKQKEKISNSYKKLRDFDIQVSLFIDADLEQIEVAAEIGVPYIEIHTGYYCNAKNDSQREIELDRIKKSIFFASNLGLKVNAGHGLTYQNVQYIASLSKISELNIGHSIISRAIMSGMEEAVKEMKWLMLEARK